MKVVQEKKKVFFPVTITLESKEEAEALRYVLRCEREDNLKHHLENSELELTDQEKVMTQVDNMFYAYIGVYHG